MLLIAPIRLLNKETYKIKLIKALIKDKRLKIKEKKFKLKRKLNTQGKKNALIFSRIRVRRPRKHCEQTRPNKMCYICSSLP